MHPILLLMDKKKEFAYMEKAFGVSPSQKGFYHLSCPYCKEPSGRSGTYKPEISRFFCLQPGCRWGKIDKPKGVSIIDVAMYVQRLPDFKSTIQYLNTFSPSSYQKIETEPTKEYSEKKVKITLPEYYTNILHGRSKVANDARAYLEGRGYDLVKLGRVYQIGYIRDVSNKGNKYGYIVIPFFDLMGDLIYYQLRGLYSYHSRWDNPSTEDLGYGKERILYNPSALWTEDTDYAFVHEGVTDALTTGGAGTLGLVLSEYHIDTIKQSPKDKIYFMYDEGAFNEGLNNAFKCINPRQKIYVIPLEKGEGDPNVLGPVKCREKLDSAIEVTEEVFNKEKLNMIWEGTKSYRGEGLNIYF